MQEPVVDKEAEAIFDSPEHKAECEELAELHAAKSAERERVQNAHYAKALGLMTTRQKVSFRRSFNKGGKGYTKPPNDKEKRRAKRKQARKSRKANR